MRIRLALLIVNSISGGAARGNPFRLLADLPKVYPEWEELAPQHAVLGKNAHDARLAAAMQVSGVGTLLTADKDDFKRFQNITAMEPKEVK